jgi:hypothetical protein
MTGATKKKRQDWGVGRAAFLACAAAICAEINEGWPITAVHRKFKDRVKLGYRQFNRHVKAWQSKKDAVSPGKSGARPPATPIAGSAHANAPLAPRREPVQPEKPTLHEFHFDPIDACRKKFASPVTARNASSNLRQFVQNRPLTGSRRGAAAPSPASSLGGDLSRH